MAAARMRSAAMKSFSCKSMNAGMEAAKQKQMQGRKKCIGEIKV